MDMQLAKMELIEMLLNTKKESVLRKIKAILEEEQDQLTEQDYQIIEARRNKHLVGESKSYSWEEVRKKLDS